MKPKIVHQQTLSKYAFKKDKPLFQSSNFTVYDGIQTDTKLPVTIKILNNFHIQLAKYLKKIKQTKSENVIKVYEFSVDQNSIIFITQQVTYGTLKNGLKNCQRLDENDTIFIYKSILNGHIELLRNDCNWFGTQDDIEFTDSGLKLSWNNSCTFNLINPFPSMFQKLSNRVENLNGGQQNLLPFPKSKIIQDLVKVSKQNASQMSLHPQLKKKEKFAKKKGKNWLGLKQYKSKSQYFDEVSYLAISETYGFVRTKVFQSGFIEPALINLNKTKNTFTKVIQYYEENSKTIIISEYSNDGNLQSYVSRLKAANIQLKEDQIQFFYYSLFEPIKQVQESQIKSINTLNIRNIYIENGIPKIGQPIPMNNNISEIMKDRAEVPDFFHPVYKQHPETHENYYDTYSLGVLLYKLMYTEYPIFPNQKVHIPTTPNYNKRLKTTLQIFLNDGGSLKSVEARIQVSENVLKQIKENKEKLVLENKSKQNKGSKKKDKQLTFVPIDDDAESVPEKEQQIKQEEYEQDDEQENDDVGCLTLCCHKLELSKEHSEKDPTIISQQTSPYKSYRICTKIIITLIFYVFLMYFYFISNTVSLLSSSNLLRTLNVTISTQNYTITTSSSTKFYTSFNLTNKTTTSLSGMGCLIDGFNSQPIYSSIVYDSSPLWLGFMSGGIAGVALLIFIKLLQIYYFDIIRVKYNIIEKLGNFNWSNYFIFSLFWLNLVHSHFYLFNFVFYGQAEPCVGIKNPYHSTTSLFTSSSSFMNVYTLQIVLEYIVVIIFLILLIKTEKVPYNKLINPIIIFLPLLIVCYLFQRIGVISNYYYPSAVNDSNSTIASYFKTIDYKGILGTIPELMWIGQLIIQFLIDLIFWLLIDKRRRMMIKDTQSDASINDINT